MNTNDSNERFSLKQTPEKTANRRHALSFCKPDGVPVDLDLSDDKQFEFLLDERGGNEYLEKYFPRYHQMLHQSRADAVEAKKRDAPAARPYLTLLEKVALGEDVSDNWQDLIQITGFVAQKTQNSSVYQVQVVAAISFVEGMQTTNAVLTIGNPNTGELIAQTSVVNVFGQGYDTIIMASGNTSTLDGIESSLTVDGLPYQTNIPIHKVARLGLQDSIDPVAPITVTNPVHNPTKHRPAGSTIKVCMGRGDTDCEYTYAYQPAGQPVVPKIAVSGSVTYAGAVAQPSADSSKFGIYFFVKRRNGGATQFFTGTDAFKYFTLTPDGHTLSWNFPEASFESSPWNQGDTIDLNLSVAISVDSPVKNTQFQVTSLPGVIGNISVAKIDPLSFVWGCLGADSLVRMEDGSEKRIDALTVGEKVQIDECGQVLTIVDLVTGREEKPCLRITTANGRSLLVTDGHPVCRPDGFCLAKELTAGDLILTESGIETVCSIKEEKYDGIVYNLKLGDIGGQRLAGSAHYANGILVGDGNMQGYLSEKRKDDARRPRSIEELPAEWRFDAENANRLKEKKSLIPANL